MDHVQSPFSLYTSTGTAVLILFITAVIVKLVQRSKTKNEPQPPGPWKLPVIGSLVHMITAGSLPHRAFRDLARKHGPFMHLQLGEISTIVISSPRLAREVMKTHDIALASRPTFPFTEIIAYNSTDIASAPYGSYWRQMRKISTMNLLSAKKVRSFRSIREDEVRNFIQDIRSSSGSTVNLSQQMYMLIYKIVSKAAFGGSFKYDHTFKLLMKEAVLLAGGFDVAHLFPSLKLLHIISGMKLKLTKLHQKIDHILDDIIDEHKKNLQVTNEKEGNNINDEKEDLVDVLLKLAESEGLEVPITSNNIKAVILDMFVAGTDTSSTLMEWTMTEMIRNPRVMDKAQAELRQIFNGKEVINESDIQGLTYLKMVIKETLRLHPPVPLLVPRVCREQCKIDGYDIPIKTRVIVNAWAIGRDPEYWDDGESFLPERFENSSIDVVGSNYEYIPFGAGRRMCPGITFGLASVELPLAQLLYHFDWKLPHGMKPEDLDMTESFGAAVKKRDELCLIATPHAAPQSA